MLAAPLLPDSVMSETSANVALIPPLRESWGRQRCSVQGILSLRWLREGENQVLEHFLEPRIQVELKTFQKDADFFQNTECPGALVQGACFWP